MNLPIDFPALPDIAATAAVIDFSYFTVRKWTYGQAKPPVGWPKPVKVGGSVRYRRTDLEAWIAGLGQQPAAQPDLPDLVVDSKATSRGPGRQRNQPRV